MKMMRLLLLLLAAVAANAQVFSPNAPSSKTIRETVVIPAGTDPSAYVTTGTATPVGIFTPAALTGTNYEFFCKFLSGDPGVAVSGITVTHANSSYVPFSSTVYTALLGCPYIALATDGTEASDRTVYLVYRDLTR